MDFQKRPSRDVDDIHRPFDFSAWPFFENPPFHPSTLRNLRVEGWKGEFSKKGQAEMLVMYVNCFISKGGRVDFQNRAKR